MEHGGEDCPLDRKLEPPAADQPLDHRPAAGLFPQPPEHQRRPDAPGRYRVEGALAQTGDQHGGLAEPGTRAQQDIELARGLQLVESTEGGDDGLAGLGAVTPVLDDLQVAAVAGGLDAEEHAMLPRDTAYLPRQSMRGEIKVPEI